MGNAVSHEALNDSETEPSALKQAKAQPNAEIIQNGPTQQNAVQDKSETDIWRFDYLMRKLHLKSRNGKADIEQDLETFTSQKTMEMSPSTNAEEKEPEKSAKTGLKSRFSFSFARSVPGRTDDPSTEPKSETAKLQTNQKTFSVNTAPIDKMNLQQSSPQKGGSTQKQQQPSTDVTEPAEKETEQPKQKEVSFFDKLFKQGDKSKPQNGHQGDLKTAGSQDLTAADKEATELIHRLDNVHQYLETGDGTKDYMTSSNGDNISQNPASAKSSENDSEKEHKAGTSADDNSVMNFFKTLVTPTKSSTKTELDSHQAPDEKKKVNGEHKEPSAKAHKLEQQEVSKTKDTDSSERPKSEKTPMQSPFGKLFKQKTVKEPQFEQENVTSTPDVKAEKGMSQPQKQISKQGSKDSEVAQQVKSEEEVKPAKKGFLNFFKQTESGLTDDPAKKELEIGENSVQPPKKAKDNSKQKKSVSEGNQEETRRTKSLEALPPTQQPNTISEPIPNGSNNKTKETTEKRPEKKQSFGMFLKQLGGKKTADAAVQTDPVVIHPAGKAK
ncbi:breast carcinoma-amplified sequence 1-like isoform X2 [Pristis pectinata]|uniref:breast carcinoma-amplified sequence 1-like isoform X2 n=1 Tax=Pristis pectinata TaxID=685728 RepID=UPI00223CA5F4|nr:breast carcinoma-amplified sequence 1-like isoform X2 [Pristis pectinata]